MQRKKGRRKHSDLSVCPKCGVNSIGRMKSTDWGHDLWEILEAVKPKSDEDRVLITGYWLLYAGGGVAEFSVATVKEELLRTGYPMIEAQRVIKSMLSQRPQLICRRTNVGKCLDLTVPGLKRVDELVP